MIGIRAGLLPAALLAAPVAAQAQGDVQAPAAADAGFSFSPGGFVQLDTGHVENPGIETASLGQATRARRIVVGAEGTLPGGFGYKAEFNLAGGDVDYEDVVLTWSPRGSPVTLTAGNFYPLSGLETMTSSRLTSFLERGQAVDAFGFNRRVGVSVGYARDDWTLAAGFFNAPLADAFGHDGRQASARATWSPAIGKRGRLHLGLNAQHRLSPADAQNVRYRTRPFSQLTGVRFVDTGAVAARGDDIVGVELAGIFGPLHLAAEGHRLWVDGHRPGTDFDPGEGAGGGAFHDGEPVFRSGYVEIGYYLTGETRGYGRGRWGGTTVLRPVGKGGFGAVQINGRIDRADLTDGAGAAMLNGGRQMGYELSLIWTPVESLRLLLQYARAGIEGGPHAATIRPDSDDPLDRRGYSVDSIALRTQLEF